MKNSPQLFEYSGAIHIHTTDSDGTWSHDKIIELGKNLNLDFLLFTDHNTLKSLDKEGKYGRLNALIGYEINDRDNKNHYLAFGIDEILPEGLDPKQYIAGVKSKNGLGIIAHPDEVREHPKYPSYPWTDWDVNGFDGIEIWNHMSAWMENASTGNMVKYFLNPRSSITAPTETILNKWDSLARKRKILGIGAIDVHAIPYKIGPFKLTIFPYKVQLQSIRTHILMKDPMPKDFKESKKAILSSLKQCRAFFSNYRWGSAIGFRFWAESSSRTALIGERIDADNRMNFYIQSPKEADIYLIHNGERVLEAHGKEATFRWTKPGVVRVELHINGKGWIYSNHIYVMSSPKRKSRKAPTANHHEHAPRKTKPNKPQHDNPSKKTNDNNQKDKEHNHPQHKKSYKPRYNKKASQAQKAHKSSQKGARKHNPPIREQ